MISQKHTFTNSDSSTNRYSSDVEPLILPAPRNGRVGITLSREESNKRKHLL